MKGSVYRFSLFLNKLILVLCIDILRTDGLCWRLGLVLLY